MGVGGRRKTSEDVQVVRDTRITKKNFLFLRIQVIQHSYLVFINVRIFSVVENKVFVLHIVAGLGEIEDRNIEQNCDLDPSPIPGPGMIECP